MRLSAWLGTTLVALAAMPATDSGKYLVRWVEENGQWRMAQDIWNSDLPPPPPAPAPAPQR